MKAILEDIFAGIRHPPDYWRDVFSRIMKGEYSDIQIAGLLVGMRGRGVSSQEIVGAAQAMRAACHKVPYLKEYPNAVDTCGTGGDGLSTINISTMSAIVAAGAGAKVIKHGNRAISSKSGSADVLGELGINTSASDQQHQASLKNAGISFLFAPDHHPATKFASPARRELGVRSIFNLLGPLTNPAGVTRQVIGVFSEKWCEPVAHALKELGSEHVLVVHGHGGIDEFAVRGETFVAELKEGVVSTHKVSPQTFHLSPQDPRELAGGSPKENAAQCLSTLSGQGTPAARCVAAMTAGAALVVSGLASSYDDGAAMALEAIDCGAALESLNQWKVSGFA